MKGIISVDAAQWLGDLGYEAYSLEGGYFSYLVYKMKEDESNEKERAAQIELSIRKKFHKELFSKFAKAINTYELVKEHDHIAVCISGGKDSMLMAKLLQELKRHNKFEFELTFLVMDPGYSPENRKIIEQNAKLISEQKKVNPFVESNIFKSVENVNLSTIVAYKEDGVRHHFLEKYEVKY